MNDYMTENALQNKFYEGVVVGVVFGTLIVGLLFLLGGN